MRIQEVVMKLLMEQPYYGYVASSVTFVEEDKIATIKMASIPDLIIYYNMEWFNHLSTDHEIGALIHELLHVLFLHPYRRGAREVILWSIACDMAVHEIMQEKYILPEGATVERIAQKLKSTIPKSKNAEYYYFFLTEQEDFQSFLAIEEDSIFISQGGNSMRIQKISEQKASTVEINALKSRLEQLYSDAKSEGEAPEGLEDVVNEVYYDIRINWRVILKRFLIGRGKIMTRKSYKRQSRRYEELPGTKRSIGVHALIAIDESGSISDNQIKGFYQELLEINKITGASMLVTRFDTQCTEPVELSRFVSDQKRVKRGGTNFRPVFQLADERKIPLVIIFTDGDGEAPLDVNQNTLWVLTKNAKKPASFGYYINYEE